jgi:hypothetical protein
METKIINHNTNNLFKKYLHNIRNMKTLDKEMINNVCNMSNEEKIDIIIAFNDILEYVITFLEY